MNDLKAVKGDSGLYVLNTYLKTISVQLVIEKYLPLHCIYPICNLLKKELPPPSFADAQPRTEDNSQPTILQQENVLLYYSGLTTCIHLTTPNRAIKFRDSSPEFLLAFAARLVGNLKFRGMTAQELANTLCGLNRNTLSFYGSALSLCQAFSQAYDFGIIISSKTDYCNWIVENVQFVNRKGKCTRRMYKYLYQRCKPSESNKLPQPGRLGYIDIAGLLIQFPPTTIST